MIKFKYLYHKVCYIKNILLKVLVNKIMLGNNLNFLNNHI